MRRPRPFPAGAFGRRGARDASGDQMCRRPPGAAGPWRRRQATRVSVEEKNIAWLIAERIWSSE